MDEAYDTERAQRARDAVAKQEMLARAERRQSAQAHEMLVAFVELAAAERWQPEDLLARPQGGRGKPMKTGLRGWYLRSNHSAGVSTSGDFYVLNAPATLRGRLLGVGLEPSDPPMVLGRGGRDGESIDLADALALTAQRLRRG